jgi:clan AA aspartic protease (TIGR02281 family)
MKQVLFLRLKLFLLTGILGLMGTACSSLPPTKLHTEQTQLAIEESPPPQKAPLQPAEPDRFELALDKASGALTIGQSAQSAEDWRLITMQWNEAIALMQSVPVHSPHKAIAQKKIIQYRHNLKYAQQQVIRLLQPRPTPVATVPIPPFPIVREPRYPLRTPFPITREPRFPIQAPLPIIRKPRYPQQAPPLLAIPTSGVFQAAIKNRHGGTPVIDVIFNGGEQFEMIVDTGASGTVITQEMASALGVVPIGKARANTASDRDVEFAVGKVRSIEVGGAVINNVPVAIAPAANLDMGLLGQDFFSNYDVTIKRDVVEFRSR